MVAQTAVSFGRLDPHFHSLASVSLNSFRAITAAKSCKLDDVDPRLVGGPALPSLSAASVSRAAGTPVPQRRRR